MSLMPKTKRKSLMTKNILFDLESTGLLRRGSTIHCIVMRDTANPDETIVFDYEPERSLI